MRKWQKPAVIVASITLFAALIVTLLLSSRAINAQMRAFCFEQLEQTSKKLAADLKNEAVMDRSMLQVIAASVAAQGDRDDQTLLTAMRSLDVNTSFFSYLEYLRADGRLLHQSGAYLDAAGTLNFEVEAKNAPYISNKEKGIYDAEGDVLRSAVPVVKDGETIGILYGIVPLSDFSKVYKTEIYDGKAFVFVEDGDSGDFLLDTWHDTLGNMTKLGQRKTLEGFEFSKLAKDLKAGSGGYIGFISETIGDILYMHYEPVGINNWNVLVTVANDVAMAQAEQIKKILYIAVIVAMVILLLYAVFITVTMEQTNRMITRLGMEDQTTQLPNRNAYDSFVKCGRDKRYAAVTCVFADLNGLHEINNTHGHDAGDQMLRCVADALKTTFKGDRVFRIGGDEFVVFCESLGLEDAWKKMETVTGILAGQNYSVSFGIAHREREQGLDRLIHEADARMLINKRAYYETHSRRKAT